jgi:hypothetical protein
MELKSCEEELINRIRQIVRLPIDVENYLRSESRMVFFVHQMLSTINDRLRRIEGLLCVIDLHRWKDAEVPEMEDLEIFVKVKVENYDLLLKLWEIVDEYAYEGIPSEISEKIVIIFEMVKV